MARPQRDLTPDSLNGHFGLEIRTYRNDAGLSQNQLADALGCTAGSRPNGEETDPDGR
jgi:transcriptional regulator with XRE-family HTH domain